MDIDLDPISKRIKEDITLDRRIADVMWRKTIESEIEVLKQGQTDVKELINKNNDMTEAMLKIFHGTQTFWNFCTKFSGICKWILKIATPIAALGVAFYHGLDYVLHHDILFSFKQLIKK